MIYSFLYWVDHCSPSSPARHGLNILLYAGHQWVKCQAFSSSCSEPSGPSRQAHRAAPAQAHTRHCKMTEIQAGGKNKAEPLSPNIYQSLDWGLRGWVEEPHPSHGEDRPELPGSLCATSYYGRGLVTVCQLQTSYWFLTAGSYHPDTLIPLIWVLWLVLRYHQAPL